MQIRHSCGEDEGTAAGRAFRRKPGGKRRAGDRSLPRRRPLRSRRGRESTAQSSLCRESGGNFQNRWWPQNTSWGTLGPSGASVPPDQKASAGSPTPIPSRPPAGGPLASPFQPQLCCLCSSRPLAGCPQGGTYCHLSEKFLDHPKSPWPSAHGSLCLCPWHHFPFAARSGAACAFVCCWSVSLRCGLPEGREGLALAGMTLGVPRKEAMRWALGVVGVPITVL